MPKRANQLKRKPTLSEGLLERQTTPRNGFDRLQVRISSIKVLGLKIHRIAIQNLKHRTRAITPHSPTLSPQQRRTIQKLTLPRLEHQHIVSVQQYVRSDPPTKVFQGYQIQMMGYTSVVWQQQMDKTILITYKNKHLSQKPTCFVS